MPADWIGIATLGVAVLGGLAHVVYRLGRLTERIEGMAEDVGDLKERVMPKPVIARAAFPDQPNRQRRRL